MPKQLRQLLIFGPPVPKGCGAESQGTKTVNAHADHPEKFYKSGNELIQDNLERGDPIQRIGNIG